MFELRLLGMRVDEALKMLERQLDLCTLHNFPKFSIIHGKGTGVLQQCRFLRKALNVWQYQAHGFLHEGPGSNDM